MQSEGVRATQRCSINCVSDCAFASASRRLHYPTRGGGDATKQGRRPTGSVRGSCAKENSPREPPRNRFVHRLEKFAAFFAAFFAAKFAAKFRVFRRAFRRKRLLLRIPQNPPPQNDMGSVQGLLNSSPNPPIGNNAAMNASRDSTTTRHKAAENSHEEATSAQCRQTLTSNFGVSRAGFQRLVPINKVVPSTKDNIRGKEKRNCALLPFSLIGDNPYTDCRRKPRVLL